MLVTRHTLIGTSIVAALSCSLIAVPAFAASPDAAVHVVSSDMNTISDFVVTQTVTPELTAGGVGDATIRVSSNGSAHTAGGMKLSLTAPSGTTFASARAAYKYSDNYGNPMTGTLSADKKTLALSFAEGLGPQGSWVQFTITLKSDADNTRSGLFDDGRFAVTEGTTLPAGLTGALGYVGDAPAATFSQQTVPAIERGKTVQTVLRYANNLSAATPKIVLFEAKAPSGTVFADVDTVKTRTSAGDVWFDAVNVRVSDDKRTLWFSPIGQSIATGGFGEVILLLTAEADSTRSGRISDGSFTVTQGNMFPLGTSTPIAYDAVQPAPVLLKTPARGSVVTDTKRPVFSGTAQPGAEVTVRGSSGRVVAQTTAASDGTWSAPAAFDFVNGFYSGTVSQSTDSSTASYEFTVNRKSNVAAVVITGPEIDAQLSPGKPVFAGKGQPGATVTVKGAFGTVLGTGVVNAQGLWSLDSTISLAPGSYSGTVSQTVNGQTTTDAFRFTIKAPEVRIAPVTLTTPAIDAQLSPGKPVFAGKGQPGATVLVKGAFGTVLGTGAVNAQGLWSLDSTISLAPGSYSGTVSQTVNGQTTTDAFRFTIKAPEVRIAPVTLTTPAIDAQLSPGKPVFAGKGQPGATVLVKGAFGTVLGTCVVNAQGLWSVDSTVALVPGSYSGTVSQTVNGQTTAEAFRFTVK